MEGRVATIESREGEKEKTRERERQRERDINEIKEIRKREGEAENIVL